MNKNDKRVIDALKRRIKVLEAYIKPKRIVEILHNSIVKKMNLLDDEIEKAINKIRREAIEEVKDDIMDEDEVKEIAREEAEEVISCASITIET